MFPYTHRFEKVYFLIKIFCFPFVSFPSHNLSVQVEVLLPQNLIFFPYCFKYHIYFLYIQAIHVLDGFVGVFFNFDITFFSFLIIFNFLSCLRHRSRCAYSQSDPSDNPVTMSYIQAKQYFCLSQKRLKAGWHRVLNISTHFSRALSKPGTDLRRAQNSVVMGTHKLHQYRNLIPFNAGVSSQCRKPFAPNVPRLPYLGSTLPCFFVNI